MGDVSASIRKYIEANVTLSKPDIANSVRTRDWFLERLTSVINNRENEPMLYSACPVVRYGSYFKGTTVKTVDEFDMLIVIDSNNGIYSVGGNPVGNGQGNASPNHKYDNKYMKDDGTGVSPNKLLNWLRGCVKEAVDPYGVDPPIRNGQSITAYIKSTDVTLDLVPAGVFTRISDGSTFYNIGDGTLLNNWIMTSPKYDIDRLDVAAKDRDDFRNVIKLMKRIRDTYNMKVKSFAIETAVVDYGINVGWYNNLYYDISAVLLYLSMVYDQKSIPDTYNPTYNLLVNSTDLSKYSTTLQSIQGRLSSLIAENDQSNVDEKVRQAFDNE